MHKLLSKLNTRLRKESCFIILFMDNAGCHPEDVAGKYSNVKVVFLPPNTTSVLQPLDLGIIKNFKVYYRKLLLCHILSKIEECNTASEVVQSVTILNAVRWVAQAWEKVTPETIKKCFRKAGILNREFQIVARVSESDDDEDPFVELDSGNSDMEDLENLISQVQDGDSSCSVEEFVSGDSDLPVCQDIFSDKWEQQFLDQITKNPSSELTEETGSSESESEAEDEQDVEPRLKSLKEVIHALEEVSSFLDYKGYTDEAYETSKLVNSVAQLHSLKSARQTTIKEYFN